jgi:CDP-glycerol glycerophosphotransferase
MRYSIILTVHNDEKRLPDCAAALLGQPCHDMEILLVDQDSEDGTLMLCQGYQAAYPNLIRVIRMKHSGTNAARNEGIRCARGEYLLFADCGSVLRPDALAFLSRHIETSRADLYLLGTQSRQPDTVLMLETAPELLTAARQCPDALWRRQLFDDAYLRFPEEPGYDDLRMLCKGMARSRSIVTVAQDICLRRAPKKTDPKERELAVLDALDDIRSYLTRRGLLECCREDLCRLAALLICDRASVVLTGRQDTAPISECIGYLNSRFPDYAKIRLPEWQGCDTAKLLEQMAQGKWNRLRMTFLVKRPREQKR